MSVGAVDTKAVEMRFDNSDFEKNAKQSISTLEKLKRALKLDGASAGLKEVEKASSKLEFKEMKGSIDSVGKRFNVLETIATGALLKIGASAAEAGTKVVKALTVDQVAAGWTKYEQKTTAVQTIMANIRDTQGRFVDESAKMAYVNGYLEKLMWFSDETSYSFTDMTDNVGKFIANGQNLEDSVTAMQGIATWAAISGQRTNTAARAMYNISQAMGTGAMRNIDWRSIEFANMATAEFKETAIAAAVAAGKLEEGQVTVESFRDSLEKGWFDKDVMMDVFKAYGEAANRVQEYAKARNISSTEAIRALKEEDKEFAKSLGFRALMAAQEAKTFREVVDATNDAVSTKWMKIFENIFGNYLEAKELWTDLSEQLWEMFASPLDTLNEIMTKWKRGFFEKGPANMIQSWFESGQLDKLENGLFMVSSEVAYLAATTDSAHYKIETLADGTKQLVKLVETADPGVYKRYTKKIYEADETLLSGRAMLLESFQNIFDTVFHDVYDENGKLESKSFFGSLSDGLKEVLFGTSEAGELVPMLSKKLWELTKGFRDWTASLKPSLETSNKIKNSFKGVLTVFKIGGKFVKAIIKPFKDLFGKTLKNAPKGLLDLADSFGTWVQKLDQYLEKNKVFEKVSSKIGTWLNKAKDGIDKFSKSITGLSVKDLGTKIKDKVFGFFQNYDFKGTFSKVTGFFKNIIGQIRSLNTGELPEKLTPLQNFWIGFKNIFQAFKKFFSFMSPIFKTVGEFINNIFGSIADAISNKKTESAGSRFKPIWDGIIEVFKGIGDFFSKIGPTLQKVGTWIGGFFSNLGDGIAKWAENKTPEEVINSLVKGGFFIALTEFFHSIAGLGKGGSKIGKAIVGDLNAIKGVLKAYKREINVDMLVELALGIGILAGSMWVLSKIPESDLERAGEALLKIAVVVVLLAKAAAMLKGAFGGGSGDGESAGGKILGPLKGLLSSTVKSSIFGNDATAKFVKIALGILLAALAAKVVVEAVGKVGDVIVKLANIPPAQIKAGGKIFAQIILALGAFAFLSGFSNKATSSLFAALAAFVLVKAVIKLANAMAELGKDSAKMEAIKETANQFKGVFDTLKTVVGWVIGIAAVLAILQIVVSGIAAKSGDSRGVSKVLKQFGKNFERIAFSLVIVAAAFAIMAAVTSSAKVTPNDVKQITVLLLGFVAIVGVLSAVVVGLSSLGKQSPAKVASLIAQFGKVFERVALALVLVAVAFAIISALKFDNASLAAISIVFLVFLIAVSALVGFASKVSKTSEMAGNFTKSVNSISGLFLAVAVSLVIVAAAFKLMDTLDMSNGRLAGVAVIFGLFIAAIYLLTNLASKIGSIGSGNLASDFQKNIGVIAGLFLAVAFSLILVAQAFALMSTLKFDNGVDFGSIALVFGGFIALVGLIGVLAGKLIWDDSMWKVIASMAGLMLATAFSLVIVAKAFEIISKLKFDNGADFGSIALVFGGFIALVGLIGVLAGKLLSDPGSLKGVAIMAGLIVVTALSLVIVADALRILTTKADPSKLNEVIPVLVTFALIVALFGVVAGTFLSAPGSLKGVAIMAGLMVVTALSLVIVADALRILTTKTDPSKLNEVIPVLVTFALIVALFGVVSAAIGKVGSLKGFAIMAGLMVVTALSLVIVANAFAVLLSQTSPSELQQVTKILWTFFGVVALLALIGTVLAATGVGVVGVFIIVGLILAIGAACLLAGVGIYLASEALTKLMDSFSKFVEFIGVYGEQFVKNIKNVMQSFFMAIIESAPLLVVAIVAVIAAVAEAGIESAGLIAYAGVKIVITFIVSLLEALTEMIPTLVYSFINFVNMLANTIRESAPLLEAAGNNLCEALIEVLLTRIKDLVEPWGPVGDQIAAKIDGWRDKIRKAFGIVVEESKTAVEDAAESYAANATGETYVPKEPPKEPYVPQVVDYYSTVGSQAKVPKTEAPSTEEIMAKVLGSSEGINQEAMMQAVASKMGLNIPLDADGNIDVAAMTGAKGFSFSGFEGMANGASIDLSSIMGSLKLPGLGEDGQVDFTQFAGITGVDMSTLESYLGTGLSSVDVSADSKKVAKQIEEPITSLDSHTWGADISSGLASGMESKEDLVRAAADHLAEVIHEILGFSEPEKGPLSDFHTYAPDMIKLWCKGINDNLGYVYSSSENMADTVYDGFSTALTYVSGLIDDGMSDELAIRPVLDLSEIQNGVGNIAGLMSSANGYEITGTARLAASTAYGMQREGNPGHDQSITQTDVGPTNNTFYITNSDPDAVAAKVSKILGSQTRRQKAVWAK